MASKLNYPAYLKEFSTSSYPSRHQVHYNPQAALRDYIIYYQKHREMGQE